MTFPRMAGTAALILAFALAVPAAMAQTAPDRCSPQQRDCTQTDRGPGRDERGSAQADQRPGQQQRPGQSQRPAEAQGQRGARADEGPRVGQSGRNGRAFQQAQNSRFSPPPRGQEYRVVNDHLVLVDRDTLKIAAVLGLLAVLTR